MNQNLSYLAVPSVNKDREVDGVSFHSPFAWYLPRKTPTATERASPSLPMAIHWCQRRRIIADSCSRSFRSYFAHAKHVSETRPNIQKSATRRKHNKSHHQSLLAVSIRLRSENFTSTILQQKFSPHRNTGIVLAAANEARKAEYRARTVAKCLAA